MVEVHVKSYDESLDMFELAADDGVQTLPAFDVPGVVLPYLVGEYGEPGEFVGKVFGLKTPESKPQGQFDTDLVSSHGCTYMGSSEDTNGAKFDLYYDLSTHYVFKVISDSNLDTVVYPSEGVV